MLTREPDFAATMPTLQEEMEARGCKLIFGVKFHPELMMIKSCYRFGLGLGLFTPSPAPCIEFN